MNQKTNLEKQVIETLRNKIVGAIESSLSGYHAPLTTFVNDIVKEKEEELKTIIRSVLGEVTASAEFKASLKEAFLHKVARTFVDNLDGSVKQAVDSLRQDPTTKARIILAVQNIIDEGCKNKS